MNVGFFENCFLENIVPRRGLDEVGSGVKYLDEACSEGCPEEANLSGRPSTASRKIAATRVTRRTFVERGYLQDATSSKVASRKVAARKVASSRAASSKIA